MRPMLILGLVTSHILLVVALRSADRSPPPVSPGLSVTARSRQVREPSGHDRAAAHPHATTPRAQPLRALLLAASEAQADPEHGSETLEWLAESVSHADLPVTLDALARNANPGAAELGQHLVRCWAESNAPAAAAWTLQLPESPWQRAAQEQVAIAWANTDAPAAAAWMKALPEGDDKHAVTLALAYETARTEPLAALEMVSKLPPTPERDDLLVHAISQWPGTDSPAAAAWAMAVLDPSLRQRLVGAVAVASAEHDGAGAATLIANALAPGDEQDRTAVSIVQRWAQSSPRTAASWVSQFPDIPARDAAAQNLLALWIAQDAEAAGDWLRELPAGRLREAGVTAYAQALADRNQTSELSMAQ